MGIFVPNLTSLAKNILRTFSTNFAVCSTICPWDESSWSWSPVQLLMTQKTKSSTIQLLPRSERNSKHTTTPVPQETRTAYSSNLFFVFSCPKRLRFFAELEKRRGTAH